MLDIDKIETTPQITQITQTKNREDNEAKMKRLYFPSRHISAKHDSSGKIPLAVKHPTIKGERSIRSLRSRFCKKNIYS